MKKSREISASELGRRLCIARKNANIRQSDAARLLNISRSTLGSIERGKRAPRAGELITLSRHYNAAVSSFFRPSAVHVDITYRFRKLLKLSKVK